MTDLRALEAAAKPVFKSRTLWALLITLLALMADKFGAKVTDAQTEQVVDLVMTIIQGGGVTAAALFRIVASGPLK